MPVLYVDGPLTLQANHLGNLAVYCNASYVCNEQELIKLVSAWLKMYPSKQEDIKTEYHNHKDGLCKPKVPWLLR